MIRGTLVLCCVWCGYGTVWVSTKVCVEWRWVVCFDCSLVVVYGLGLCIPFRHAFKCCALCTKYGGVEGITRLGGWRGLAVHCGRWMWTGGCPGCLPDGARFAHSVVEGTLACVDVYGRFADRGVRLGRF